MKKIVILCAGGKNWDRKEIVINGEKIIDRTVRLLKERGFEDVYLSVQKGETFHTNHELIFNPLNGNDLGCIYGIKEHKADLFLFGDVYFSEMAIDRILYSANEFHGRSTSGKTKKYGEMFAITATPRLMHVLEQMWQEYQSGKIKRLWSWDLYSRIQEASFYLFGNTGNFTEIHDETDDFDKPEQVELWKIKNLK